MSLQINNANNFKKILNKLQIQFTDSSGNDVSNLNMNDTVSITEPFTWYSSWWVWLIIAAVLIIIGLVISICLFKKNKKVKDNYQEVEETEHTGMNTESLNKNPVSKSNKTDDKNSFFNSKIHKEKVENPIN